MKKKFSSIAMSFLLCVCSIFMLSACGKEEAKPIVVAQHEAEEAFNQAMQTLAETKSVKLTMEMPMGMGRLITIETEDVSYAEMTMTEGEDSYNAKSWTKQENDAFATYSFVESTGDEEYSAATKTISLLPEDMMESEAFESFEGMDFENFSEATKLNGELSIVFTEVVDGETLTLTAKIVDNKLVSITVKQSFISMTMYIAYGDFSSEIPAIPEKDWDVTSTIEVPGIKTEFVVGEELNLEGLKLRFYEYEYADYVEIDLDNEMIQSIVSGFNSSEANAEGVMTITLYGLTVEIPYTVVEEYNQTETSTLLYQIAQTMQSYLEISATVTDLEGTTNTVVQKDVLYDYDDEDYQSWILKDSEDGKWYSYSKLYELIDTNGTTSKQEIYKKSECDIPNDDARIAFLGQFFESLSMLSFVEAINYGEQTIVKYQLIDEVTVDVTITIEDGLLTSMVMSTCVQTGGDPIVLVTYNFVCSQIETVTIPGLPDVDWVLSEE